MSTAIDREAEIVEKTYLCLRCRTRKPSSMMHSKICCNKCGQEDQNAEEKLRQKQILGNAIGAVARGIAQDPSFLQKPHVVYNALMTRLGGIDGFANMMVSDLEEMRAVTGPMRSNKVILDYYKAILACGIEAQKTIPEQKSLSHMTDDELGNEAIRLAQERYRLVREEEEAKRQTLALIAEAVDVE